MGEMRKKNRQLSDKDAFELLANCAEITISMYDTKNSEPYAVIVNPVLIDKTVYIHCAGEGRKIDILKENNKVCLSAHVRASVLEEKFTTAYESVVAYADAYFVTEQSEKEQVLYKLCEKHTPSQDLEQVMRYTAPRLNKTTIIAFPIDRITGKANQRNKL